MKGDKCVLLISGGMDSTVLLGDLRTQGRDVFTVSFNYGQRHSKELQCLNDVLDYYNIIERHKYVDMRPVGALLRKGSLSGNDEVPHGMYDDEVMKSTIVPNRNMIMISIAVGYAISIGATSVYYAAHAGDHAIYPDCTEEFVKSLDTTVFIGNKWNEIDVRSPFIKMGKDELVGVGLRNMSPLELTWSCYEGKDRPCLKCGTCIERTEAFLLNDVVDPALSDDEWKEAVRLYSIFKSQE